MFTVQGMGAIDTTRRISERIEEDAEGCGVRIPQGSHEENVALHVGHLRRKR